MKSRFAILSGAFVFACAAVLWPACACIAYAQDSFPSKPLQIIVPTGPGGGTDTAARLLARVFNEDRKSTRLNSSH